MTIPKRPGISTEFNVEAVTDKPHSLPNAAILYAVEGWGKTSFAAMAPSPIFLMTQGEQGLVTLINNKQLPPAKHFPRPAETWLEVQQAVSSLIVNEHPYKTFVIDTFNGAEGLLHIAHCAAEYNGDWGDKGFMSFQKGYKTALPLVTDFLKQLDKLRQRGMSVILLCHATVTNFKNPEGPDYDKYAPALHRETWGVLAKWADMILFGNYEVSIDKMNARKSNAETRGKAQGGRDRILYTTNCAAYTAKNRHGLPEEIECGSSPQEAWSNFIEALKGNK